MNKTLFKFATLGLLAAAVALPSASLAQSSYSRHRDQKKNEWKNIGIASAAVGVYGLVKGDKTMTIAGAAGAAYSAYRYSQDGRNDRNRHFDRLGYDQSGYNRDGYNRSGYNRSGYNRDGYNRDGYDRNGRRRSGYSSRPQSYDRYDNDSRYDRYDRDDRDGRWDGRGPGNSDWGRSRGNGKKNGHYKHGRN